jgi:hypothetical protein
MRTLPPLALAVPALLASASLFPAAAWVRLPPSGPRVEVDWQSPQLLPPRFRNHCVYGRGRFYCSDHCGFDYQLYYCSRESFGCCRVGFGYCGWDGLLRCAP